MQTQEVTKKLKRDGIYSEDDDINALCRFIEDHVINQPDPRNRKLICYLSTQLFKKEVDLILCDPIILNTRDPETRKKINTTEGLLSDIKERTVHESLQVINFSNHEEMVKALNGCDELYGKNGWSTSFSKIKNPPAIIINGELDYPIFNYTINFR